MKTNIELAPLSPLPHGEDAQHTASTNRHQRIAALAERLSKLDDPEWNKQGIVAKLLAHCPRDTQ